MNGTFRPRIAARLSNNLVNSTAAFFERPGGVLAIVFASALVTGASSYIVISTAIEASRFSSERNAAVLPPQAEDTRSYPTPDTLDMAMPGIARSRPRQSDSAGVEPTERGRGCAGHRAD